PTAGYQPARRLSACSTPHCTVTVTWLLVIPLWVTASGCAPVALAGIVILSWYTPSAPDGSVAEVTVASRSPNFAVTGDNTFPAASTVPSPVAVSVSDPPAATGALAGIAYNTGSAGTSVSVRFETENPRS